MTHQTPAERRARAMFDQELEERVVLAMASDPTVFALCDEIEAADFATYRAGLIFQAMRVVHATKAGAVSFATIAQRIADVDQLLGTHASDHVNQFALVKLAGERRAFGSTTEAITAILALRQKRLFRERMIASESPR